MLHLITYNYTTNLTFEKNNALHCSDINKNNINGYQDNASLNLKCIIVAHFYIFLQQPFKK